MNNMLLKLKTFRRFDTEEQCDARLIISSSPIGAGDCQVHAGVQESPCENSLKQELRIEIPNSDFVGRGQPRNAYDANISQLGIDSSAEDRETALHVSVTESTEDFGETNN